MNRVEESLLALKPHRLLKCLLIVFIFSLIFSLLFSGMRFMNVQPVYGYGPGTLYQSHPTTHEISAIAGAVTNPTYGYDQDNDTYTTIQYGYGPAGYYQLVTFDVPTLDYAITQVDFKMNYSAESNAKGEEYKIDYYVGATAGTTILQDWTGTAHSLGVREWTNVAEPIDATWNWTDVSNIKFRISISAFSSPTTSSLIHEHEAWVTVHYTTPDHPTISVSPSNVTDYAITPNTTVTLRPDGDGTYHQWAGTPSNTYDDWDDITPDGDSSYFYTNATDYANAFKMQSSTLQNAGATETWSIAGVRIVIAAKSTSDYDAIQLMLVVGGYFYFGAICGLTDEYATYTSEWAWNPTTNDYWTWSDVNATEAGVFSRPGGEIWVTQLYVEVIGSRLVCDISVDYVEGLYGFGFELIFDPNVIRGVYYSNPFPFKLGPFLTSAGGTETLIEGPGWNNTVGKLKITGAVLQTPVPPTTPKEISPTGGGVLATVVFQVVHFGETEILLGENTHLKDYTGEMVVYGRDYVEDGYFRNIDVAALPTTSFTFAPVGTPVPLEGYNTTFTSTSTPAGGKTIASYKWYFWETYHSVLYEFPSVVFIPDGDGTYTDWTGDYTDWNEIPLHADLDQSYVKTTADAMYESSTLEDHTSETWPIGKVKVTIKAKTNETTSDEKVKIMLVIGGIKYIREGQSLGPTYQDFTREWETNPATGVAWNWSAIDALEAGVASEQVDAWTGEIRVTQIYIEVFPAPIVTSTDTEPWNIVTLNFTRRGLWNVTLTVIDDQGVVGTTTGSVDVKAHDVAIINMLLNTTAGETPRMNQTDIGDIVEINITIINEGDYTEDTTVSCFWSALETYYGPIDNSIVSPTAVLGLAPGENRTLTFYWDTAGHNLSHAIAYTLHANASRVQYEYDVEWRYASIADNEFIGHDVRVRFHDIAVTEITANATAVWAGEVVEFSVTVVNQGDYNQTSITLTLYNETDVIGSQVIPLLTNQSFSELPPPWQGEHATTLTFIWDTTDMPWANYTIKAEATWTGWAAEDYEPHDNTLVEYFYVKIIGDVDGDGDVDGFDLTYMCGAYGATPGHPKWDEECDINGDDIIDGFDLTPAAGNYGKHL